MMEVDSIVLGHSQEFRFGKMYDGHPCTSTDERSTVRIDGHGCPSYVSSQNPGDREGVGAVRGNLRFSRNKPKDYQL